MTTPSGRQPTPKLSETPMTVCPHCDGMGEWDEGPINTHGGWCDPADPIYRQVICEECQGLGRIPRTIYFAGAELEVPTGEPFAVVKIDVSKPCGTGVLGTVDSLYWSREVAEGISGQLNRTFGQEAHDA